MNRRRFNYLRDGLFLLSCLGYGINQVMLKPWFESPFLHGYLNDFLLIPCALPPVLFLHRLLGWRLPDLPPLPGEVLGHLVLWSILFEGVGPRLVPWATGDWRDAVAYAVGAAAALAWWWRDGLLEQRVRMDAAKA